METTIKTYKTPKEFQKDQPKMAKQGWQVQNTSSHQPRPGLGRIALLGFGAMVFKPKPQIIVTYQRDMMTQPQMPHFQPPSQPIEPQPPVQALSFKEQMRQAWQQGSQKRKDKFGF